MFQAKKGKTHEGKKWQKKGSLENNAYFFIFFWKFGADFVSHALRSLFLPLSSAPTALLNATHFCCTRLRGQNGRNKYWRCKKHD